MDFHHYPLYRYVLAETGQAGAQGKHGYSTLRVDLQKFAMAAHRHQGAIGMAFAEARQIAPGQPSPLCRFQVVSQQP